MTEQGPLPETTQAFVGEVSTRAGQDSTGPAVFGGKLLNGDPDPTISYEFRYNPRENGYSAQLHVTEVVIPRDAEQTNGANTDILSTAIAVDTGVVTIFQGKVAMNGSSSNTEVPVTDDILNGWVTLLIEPDQMEKQ